MTETIVLHGHCPSKKNLWKRGKGGRTYIDSEVKAVIDALTAQARAQWNHEPVTHPQVCVQFFARDRRRDRDNMFTTVLDCLREAGVIVNDNIAQFNGTLVVVPEFSEQYARARERQADVLAGQILEISDDGSRDTIQTEDGEVVNHEHIQRSRLRVDSRKWLASKLAPKKYGEKVAAELSGPNGGPIQQETLIVEYIRPPKETED